MQFVFGFAGVPTAVYDHVFKARARICGDNGEFVSRPAKHLGSVSSMQALVHFLTKEFVDRLRADHENALQHTAFVIVAVGEAAAAAAEDLAFPAGLVVPVVWELEGSTPTEIRRSANELLAGLETACARAKRQLPTLAKLLKEKAASTPLLLPLGNFDSAHLRAELLAFQREIASGEDIAVSVGRAIARVDRRHPPQKFDDKQRPCYVDDRRVEFHSPGSARHAFARLESDHPDRCIFEGLRRHGVPYDRAFHYDCRRGPRGNLKGRFRCCHHEAEPWEGNPHLNIAPNDFIRI